MLQTACNHLSLQLMTATTKMMKRRRMMMKRKTTTRKTKKRMRRMMIPWLEAQWPRTQKGRARTLKLMTRI
jgi:hypothetical protein